VFGNLFAFFAGLGAAGLFSYLYPRMRGRQAGEVNVWRAGERSRLRGLTDLNVATEEELQELSGIGPALAARIVENRPYRGKLELVSRMVIPEAVYARIKDEIGVSDEAADASVEVAI
jgi:radical SAM superfamily enzyme with C-terminal helix-hairpin-helix motif